MKICELKMFSLVSGVVFFCHNLYQRVFQFMPRNLIPALPGKIPGLKRCTDDP